MVRCYNLQPSFYLGNITKGTFKRFKGPRPCMARRCTCVVPANRNMIRFGNKAPTLTMLRSCVRGWPGTVSYVFTKVMSLLRNRLSRGR